MQRESRTEVEAELFDLLPERHRRREQRLLLLTVGRGRTIAGSLPLAPRYLRENGFGTLFSVLSEDRVALTKEEEEEGREKKGG